MRVDFFKVSKLHLSIYLPFTLIILCKHEQNHSNRFYVSLVSIQKNNYAYVNGNNIHIDRNVLNHHFWFAKVKRLLQCTGDAYNVSTKTLRNHTKVKIKLYVRKKLYPTRKIVRVWCIYLKSLRYFRIYKLAIRNRTFIFNEPKFGKNK